MSPQRRVKPPHWPVPVPHAWTMKLYGQYNTEGPDLCAEKVWKDKVPIVGDWGMLRKLKLEFHNGEESKAKHAMRMGNGRICVKQSGWNIVC